MVKNEDCPLMGMVFALKKKCSDMDEKILTELGLHQSELQFFTALESCGEISSSVLGKEMKLSPSRISRIIDKLVNNGYLKRGVSSNDRRAIKLELTEEGESVYNRIIESRRSCETGLLKLLTEEEVIQFKTILTKINREM